MVAATVMRPSLGAMAAAIPRTVVAVAGIAILALLVLANAYGFHRDELYFIVAGQHPDLGYVDQGPITPILSAIGVAILGVTPIAIRILPALVVGTCIVLAAAMARDMGGGRRAQEVAAVTIAVSGFLMAGHIAATATYDLLAWTIASWLVVRLLGGADQRLWLAVGVVVGLGLLNKYTIALLPVGLLVGIVAERRWAIFRSRWAWAGAAVALALWAPNLVWQAAHDFPQLDMARHIATAAGPENRDQFIVLQVLLGGPLLWPVAVIGFLRLVAVPDARPWRMFAWAYVIAALLTYQQSGKAYYLLGLFPVLFAAGSIPVGAWLERGRRWLRLAAFGAVAAVSGALVAVLVLPIVPASSLDSSGLLDANKELGEQVGWPELAAEVDRVVAGLPADERSRAAIITANYAEAGAIELLSAGHPPVYSGHNSYWDFGRPADDTRVAIVVGRAGTQGLSQCDSAGWVDNDAGVPNDERGASIIVCRGMPPSWADVWPDYRHYD